MEDTIVIKHKKIKNKIHRISTSADISFSFTSKDGKKKFFKVQNKFCNPDNEIIADAFFNALGLPHVNHKKAKYISAEGIEYEGVISNDYKSPAKDVEIISYEKVTTQHKSATIAIESMKEDIEKFLRGNHKNSSYTTNAQQVNFSKDFDLNYKKLAIMLCLSGQKDPYASNFEFMVKKNGKECFVMQAPYFDNSISFYRTIEDFKEPTQLSKEERKRTMMFYRPVLVLTKQNSGWANRHEFYEEIYNELKTNKELEDFYHKILQLDFEKDIYAYTSASKHRNVNFQSIDFAVECFNFNRGLLAQGLNKAKQKENQVLVKQGKQALSEDRQY